MRRPRFSPREFSPQSLIESQPSCAPLLSWCMAQVLQIDRAVFDEAPNLTSVAETVAVRSAPVAAAQPIAQFQPAWYQTPIVLLPAAAAAFIIGNVLMMIPWSTF
jgi:hypothetical protein